MFDDVLIESAGKDNHTGAWVSTLLSIIVHVALLGAAIMAGVYAKENPEVISRPIAAFIVAAAPPPPPPPPPPGPATSVASTPRVEPQIEREQPEFRQITEMPQDLPQVTTTAPSAPETPVDGGMPGGQEGGQRGGIVGGQVGGETGGQLGGVIGGTGTTLGGKGTQPGGGNTFEVPVRVGGNVLPPKIVTRVDPRYTEAARRAKIEGTVIIEAVIDRSGNVTEARVLKALSFGLEEQALHASRAWKFRPGTLNGQPVPVYYNLSVNFKID